MQKPKQIVHAQVRNPILVRKTLLESAIAVTELQKSLQKIKKIRAEKKHFKNELKISYDEIRKLIEQLATSELPRPPSMPHQSFKQLKKEIKKETTKRVEQEKLVQHEDSGLDYELKKLQDKLKNL